MGPKGTSVWSGGSVFYYLINDLLQSLAMSGIKVPGMAGRLLVKAIGTPRIAWSLPRALPSC